MGAKLMSLPLPFQIARETSNNFGNAFTKVRDENAIESILSNAMSSNDPAQLQQSIGKILSQVSPERQGAAVQYLQNTMNTLQQKQEQNRKIGQEQRAAKQAGYTPNAPPQVQAQQVKENAKAQRLSQYGFGGDVSSNGQPNPSTEPTNVPATLPNGQKTQPEQTGSFLKKLTDDHLKLLTGAPDREISEPAKAELQERENQEKIQQKQKDLVFKSDLDRANKIIERSEEIAEQLPQKRTALGLMKDAISNKNLGWWSPDNLAEITGIEAFRSPEGALFKTAGKEYFLGSISRAGTRPNQWIEQQIADMMTKIGRSTEANLSVSRALENELDLDTERVRLTEDISERLRKNGDLSQSSLGKELNKEMSAYAEKKQRELYNDLRAIKAIAEKKPQRYKTVEKGTKVSPVIAQSLLLQFNNDPKKAADEAKKLGYEF